jgi:hypothetical protein
MGKSNIVFFCRAQTIQAGSFPTRNTASDTPVRHGFLTVKYRFVLTQAVRQAIINGPAIVQITPRWIRAICCATHRGSPHHLIAWLILQSVLASIGTIAKGALDSMVKEDGEEKNVEEGRKQAFSRHFKLTDIWPSVLYVDCGGLLHAKVRQQTAKGAGGLVKYRPVVPVNDCCSWLA